MFNVSNECKLAFHLTLPTVIAYTVLGFVFGLLATHQGFDWYIAPLMSGLIYAGSVQFMALSMISEHASLAAMMIAALFIALRNSFYGLSLSERFRPAPPWIKFFLIFALVDASYALISIKEEQADDARFCFYVTLFPYLCWVLSSLAGALFADTLPSIKGLHFILVSFFGTLVVEYYLKFRRIDALVLPIIAACLAYWILPQYYLLFAICSCAIYLYIREGKTR